MGHICSHQIVWTFDNFLRPLVHNPVKLFGPYIKPGMRVLDVGCGAGFATVGIARLVGDGGRVLAVDIQPEMLAKVKQRVDQAGLGDRIETHLCQADSLCVEGPFEFINAFYMVHEVPDTISFLKEVHTNLTPGGKLLERISKINLDI